MSRTDPRKRKAAEAARRCAAIGTLAEFARKNPTDSLAGAVNVLLAECSRLADLVPEAERRRVDAEIMLAAVNEYRRENARLRRLLDQHG